MKTLTCSSPFPCYFLCLIIHLAVKELSHLLARSGFNSPKAHLQVVPGFLIYAVCTFITVLEVCIFELCQHVEYSRSCIFRYFVQSYSSSFLGLLICLRKPQSTVPVFQVFQRLRKPPRRKADGTCDDRSRHSFENSYQSPKCVAFSLGDRLIFHTHANTDTIIVV